MKLHMILAYGRRKEFENKPPLSQQRASLMTAPDEELMSYDRLDLDKDLEPAITVRAMGSGRYKVCWLPLTFSVSPGLADRLLHIDGFGEALDANPEIGPERRAFLKDRIAYWKEWAGRPGGKLMETGYREC
jgi:hypothetical protein